jgi:hypothetical protein
VLGGAGRFSSKWPPFLNWGAAHFPVLAGFEITEPTFFRLAGVLTLGLTRADGRKWHKTFT